jgi:hypothetical protein
LFHVRYNDNWLLIFYLFIKGKNGYSYDNCNIINHYNIKLS